MAVEAAHNHVSVRVNDQREIGTSPALKPAQNYGPPIRTRTCEQSQGTTGSATRRTCVLPGALPTALPTE